MPSVGSAASLASTRPSAIRSGWSCCSTYAGTPIASDAVDVARPGAEAEAVQDVERLLARSQRLGAAGRRGAERERSGERDARRERGSQTRVNGERGPFRTIGRTPHRVRITEGRAGIKSRGSSVKMSLQWPIGAVSPTNAASSASVDSEDAANLAYLGLYALQHRGQESAGIASLDGRRDPRRARDGLRRRRLRRGAPRRACRAAPPSGTCGTRPPAPRC